MWHVYKCRRGYRNWYIKMKILGLWEAGGEGGFGQRRCLVTSLVQPAKVEDVLSIVAA